MFPLRVRAWFGGKKSTKTRDRMDPYLSACTAGAPLNPSSPLPFRRSVAGCHASASRQVPHQLSEHHKRCIQVRTVELHALARLVGGVYNAINMVFTGKPGKYI
jgi:hypothetical protein